MNSPLTQHPTAKRPRRGRLRAAAAAVAAAALILTGCASQPSADPTAGPAKELDKMVFLSYLPFETTSLAPEMLAYAAGYFEEEGLDIQLQPVTGSPVALQGLLGGVAPITRVGGIDVLTTASQGQPLVNVGTLERGGGFRLVSAKEAPITELKELQGKTIGVGSRGGTSEKTLRLAMSAAGLDPDSIELQVVGLTPATFALVQQGQIDAYLLGIDTAEMVAAQNADAVLSPAEMLIAPTDIQVYAGTETSVETHSDQIKRFLKAIQRAVDFIVADENLEETIKILRSEFSFAALDDDEVAKASLDAYRKVWLGDGKFPILETDIPRWEAAYDLLVEAGLSEPNGDPLAWVTNDLVPAP